MPHSHLYLALPIRLDEYTNAACAQTIAAKFEQVGAELELSYDDAGAKPEARRQELARLRKQQADNQDYVLEMEEELAELQTQNDQLRRKAASIERELVSDLSARSCRCSLVLTVTKKMRLPVSSGGEWSAPNHEDNAGTASVQELSIAEARRPSPGATKARHRRRSKCASASAEGANPTRTNCRWCWVRGCPDRWLSFQGLRRSGRAQTNVQSQGYPRGD